MRILLSTLLLLAAADRIPGGTASQPAPISNPADPQAQGSVDRREAYRQQLASWQARADAAMRQGEGNIALELDDSRWASMELPCNWEEHGLPHLDGLVWFRKTVDLPSSWLGKDLKLTLGPIDDMDLTWFNGTQVGSHVGPDQHSVAREYEVGSALLRSGRNVITVLVLDTGRGGGICGQPEQMTFRPTDSPDEPAISLAGTWRYQVGADLGPRPSLPGTGKENDSDVNYDEARVPAYDLPPLLVTAEGTPVTTAGQWVDVRRPQILSLFSNLIYGRVPEPEDPLRTEFEVVKSDPDFMGGRATRKDVRIRFSNLNGTAEMLVLVFVPNQATHPVPAFMMHSFDDTASRNFDAHPQQEGRLRNGWPLGLFLDRGYVLVVVYQQDLVGHNEVEFQKSIHRLFYRMGQSFPKANEWGVLGAMAWGASRAMDYLETDAAIDASHVAIMGHSKCGKATLWTAAQDQRFALAISAQSECAGAALWRRKSGETLEKMVTRFPYWLCRNAWKFVGQEDDLPMDQHMLLACIAPRPVYVHSGVDDTWADPRGEYLSAYHASEVYRLLGKQGLESETSPPLGQAIIESDVGYHIRPGGHSIEMFD
ncbi:MAG: hypothetical protein KDM81_07085, partial [Verrucomicrobiae bacterium]|nr:hypothetical protein [Verrucomicrobiae bacterium]